MQVPISRWKHPIKNLTLIVPNPFQGPLVTVHRAKKSQQHHQSFHRHWISKVMQITSKWGRKKKGKENHTWKISKVHLSERWYLFVQAQCLTLEWEMYVFEQAQRLTLEWEMVCVCTGTTLNIWVRDVCVCTDTMHNTWVRDGMCWTGTMYNNWVRDGMCLNRHNVEQLSERWYVFVQTQH